MRKTSTTKAKGKKSRPKTKLGIPDLEHSKAAVLRSLGSPDSVRGYQHAIEEFVAWYCSELQLVQGLHRERLPAGHGSFPRRIQGVQVQEQHVEHRYPHDARRPPYRNLFSGQFLFDDDIVDTSLFAAQARRYGFDESEYIIALDRVPRLSGFRRCFRRRGFI